MRSACSNISHLPLCLVEVCCYDPQVFQPAHTILLPLSLQPLASPLTIAGKVQVFSAPPPRSDTGSMKPHKQLLHLHR